MNDLIERLRDYGMTLEENVVFAHRDAIEGAIKALEAADAMAEALKWAFDELDGLTKYTDKQQRENAWTEADKRLTAYRAATKKG